LSGLESLTNGIGSLVSMDRHNQHPARRNITLPLPGESGPGSLLALRDGRRSTAWRPAYQRLTPDFYTLRVKPQDVLILCSDGLIDERSALMPQETAQIVTEYQDAPADHLAMQLVKAANDMQEWPSKGDNITAVVLKFHG
jgi:serine/threonine protein phosphatase PrpC